MSEEIKTTRIYDVHGSVDDVPVDAKTGLALCLKGRVPGRPKEVSSVIRDVHGNASKPAP